MCYSNQIVTKELSEVVKEVDLHEQCHMRDQCQKYEICPMGLVHKMVLGKWKMVILWF